MTFTVVFSRASMGIEAPLVSVETYLSRGFRKFTIVGLPETAVKESKDRVKAALARCGFEFPKGNITVNLAPADLPKEGSRFDLPIAVSILIASEQLICPNINDFEFAGELSLNGDLRSIKGVLPFALSTQKAQRQLIIPAANKSEATWVSPLTIFAPNNFLAVIDHLSGRLPLLPDHFNPTILNQPQFECLSDVCGQHNAKRALEIAAAGGHSMLMIGPPGTGKTMLACRLSSILPQLLQSEALEIAAIYSISPQGFHPRLFNQRPFRRPHHTASAISLIGGGKQPLPGEVSMAHKGVLFLDELPEFHRSVLEVLREPIESGTVHISRAAGRADFPAEFQLIAAMNPCPCGYLTHPLHECNCSCEQISRYRNKISGPLLDRIDMHIEVPTMPIANLNNHSSDQEESSDVIRERVTKARARQLARSPNFNAKLTMPEINKFCKLNKESQEVLTNALEKLGISARAYHRILKVARTIADLSEANEIGIEHLRQALQYRKYDHH